MGVSYKRERQCECGTRVSDQCKTGSCRRCNLRKMNADPELRQRREETSRRRLREDPLLLAKKRAVMRQNIRTALAKPGVREAYAERARAAVRLMFTPDAIERKRIGHAKAMAKRAERHFAWCPPEKREQYDNLVRNMRFKAAEAKQIILDQIKAEESRLSPFERQMRALERGGKIVANDRRPSFGQPVDHGEAKWKRSA